MLVPQQGHILVKCVTLKSERAILWGSWGLTMMLSELRYAALVPSLPLPSPNIMRDRRGRTGIDTKKDIVVCRVCHIHSYTKTEQIPGLHSAVVLDIP